MTPSYHGLRALHHRLPTSGYALSTPNMSNGCTSRPATGHALSTLAFLPHASRSACFFFKPRGELRPAWNPRPKSCPGGVTHCSTGEDPVPVGLAAAGFALPMTPSYHGLRALHHRLPTSGYALSTPNMSNGCTSRPATGHALSTFAFLPHASRSACFFFSNQGGSAHLDSARRDRQYHTTPPHAILSPPFSPSPLQSDIALVVRVANTLQLGVYDLKRRKLQTSHNPLVTAHHPIRPYAGHSAPCDTTAPTPRTV